MTTRVSCEACGESGEVAGGDEQAWVDTVTAQHAETGCTGTLEVVPDEGVA